MVRAIASGVRSATLPAPASLPRRRIVTSSANAITSRNLCVIIRMVSSPATHHAAQHAQHLVGLAGRQHRGRLVQDQEAALQVKLLEDLAFLPLAGGDVGDLGIERHLERHPREKRFERLLLLAPVDHGRHVVARQHEVLGDRHRRHQREVLVDHAEPERMRVLRIGDRLFAAADQHVARGRVVVAHDAFDERRLARAVLAEQRVECAGLDLQLDIVQRGEIAEPHGHGDGFDAEAFVAGVRRRVTR